MSRASPRTTSATARPPCAPPCRSPRGGDRPLCQAPPHQDYLTFLRLIDKEVPSALDSHLVVDNYATHKHAKVRAWLARHPRFHVHFTPTYSSWSNQVERWFGLISQRVIKRGSFTSVTGLIRRIHEFTRAYNKDTRPFVWVATAQSILDKIERLSTRISDSRH